MPTKENIEQAKEVWEQFGNICIDEDECIDTEFEATFGNDDQVSFDKGTERFDIWHWVEERFGVSIAIDLMGLENSLSS